jgi:hypothetical protein
MARQPGLHPTSKGAAAGWYNAMIDVTPEGVNRERGLMNPDLSPPSVSASPPEAALPTNGEPLPELDPEVIPNLDELVTEDEKPVDSILIEKQQRLLTEPLYSSWPGPGEGRPFLALANVGLFHTVGEPPLVPDNLLSLDVSAPADLHVKSGRSYFVWLIGKVPDAVIEIVSDRRGGEDGLKMRTYARLRIPYYVIYDPEEWLEGGVLRTFVLQGSKYESLEPGWLPEVGLGLKLWQGTYEGHTNDWLRWCDREGRVIPTGAERAAEATSRAERLAARLRELGVDPEA